MDVRGQEDRVTPRVHFGKQVTSPQPWQGLMSSDIGLLGESHPDRKCTRLVMRPCPLQIFAVRTLLPRLLGVVRLIMQQTQSRPSPLPPEMAEACLAYRPRRVESPGKARDTAGARPT